MQRAVGRGKMLSHIRKGFQLQCNNKESVKYQKRRSLTWKGAFCLLALHQHGTRVQGGILCRTKCQMVPLNTHYQSHGTLLCEVVDCFMLGRLQFGMLSLPTGNTLLGGSKTEVLNSPHAPSSIAQDSVQIEAGTGNGDGPDSGYRATSSGPCEAALARACMTHGHVHQGTGAPDSMAGHTPPISGSLMS